MRSSSRGQPRPVRAGGSVSRETSGVLVSRETGQPRPVRGLMGDVTSDIVHRCAPLWSGALAAPETTASSRHPVCRRHGTDPCTSPGPHPRSPDPGGGMHRRAPRLPTGTPGPVPRTWTWDWTSRGRPRAARQKSRLQRVSSAPGGTRPRPCVPLAAHATSLTSALSDRARSRQVTQQRHAAGAARGSHGSPTPRAREGSRAAVT